MPVQRVKPKLRFKEFNDSWRNVLLEDVAIRGSGHTPSKNYPEYYNGGIKWISLADSKKLDNGYIETTEIEISQEGINNSSAVLHPKGTVLLSRDAGVGKSAIMRSEMAVSQHFIVWQPLPKKLANWFLYYQLQILKPEFERIAIGSTIKTIGLPYFKKLRITIPEFNEQQKIASFLSAVDEKIRQLTRKKELLEQYKKGVMQQLFSGKVRFKDENGKPFPKWEGKRLIDFNDLVQGDGDWILSENIGVNEKHLIIQLGNIGFGAFINKEMKTLSEENFIEVKGTPIRKGDLLLNRMVDDDKINVCLFDYVGDYVTSVDVCWIRSASGIVNQFLMYLLLVRSNQKALLSLSSGSGRVRISKKNLFERFTFKLPCLAEQQKIASFLSAIDSKIEILSKQIEQIQTFKKGLLQQMFV